MALCKPCAERGRRGVPAAREIGGTPMCQCCINGAPVGREPLPAPHFERVPALSRNWDLLFQNLLALPKTEDLAVHPVPGQTPNALREVIRRKAKARGVDVRFRVVEGVVRIRPVATHATL